MAVEASQTNDRLLKHKLSVILAKRLKKKLEAEQFGNILKQVVVEFTLKVGAKGKSFGVVTSKDIEASLKVLGYQVDRRQIRLVDAIKSSGLHTVEVKLHSEVAIPLQIKVIAAQLAAPVVSAEEGEAGKGRRRGRKMAAAEDAFDGDSEAAAQTGQSVESESAE